MNIDNYTEKFFENSVIGGEQALEKTEIAFSKRVAALSSKLAEAYLADLKATREERLGIF